MIRRALIRDIVRYRGARGKVRGPVSFLEQRYLRHAETYLQTGVTPMRCHALRSSCFVDSWGDVYPCGMYDRKLGNLREHGMALEPIWNAPRTRQTQRQIWDYDCPQCWTPCEAYQSILGNLPGHRDTRSPSR